MLTAEAAREGAKEVPEAGRLPRLLVEHLGEVAVAEDGMKHLRRSLLRLSLRGLLSTNQPTEPPCSIEETAREERARLGVPSNWRVCRLKDVAAVEMGNSPPGTTYNEVGEGVPLVNGPVEFSPGPFGPSLRTKFTTAPTKMCRTGDLLVCVRGATTGRTNVAAFDACIGRGVALIRAQQLQHYINYVMWSVGSDLLAQGTGTTFPAISSEHLTEMVVAMPPLAEQKRIVAKVDQLMALCDDLEAKQTKKRDLATQSTRSALTALAAAERGAELSLAWQRVASSFQTLVSTPDDVRNLRSAVAELATKGLLTAQSEKERPAAQLTAKLDAARAGDTDTLPLLPSNWLWARLVDLLAFGPKNGYSPKAVEYPTDVKALTLSATTSGRFAPQYFKYIDEKIPKDSDLWLRDGDVLIQRGNTLDYVGIAAVYRGRDAEFIYPDLMIKIRAADFVDVDFLHLALNARPTRDYFKAHASGTSGTMPKINQSVLLETPIPVPPLAEQKRIVAKVDHLISLLDDLEAKLRKQEETATRLAESLAAAVAA